MSDLLGQYVGRYHIVERLGAGGMATVFKAFDARLERDVAIKFIRTDVVRDEMFLKRFEREAKALARLSHPNIVKVLDYGEHEGIPYLVMEYVRGDTLKAKLGEPIPWREASRMLVDAAQALDYTHKQNIIHRDVKPSNFLLSDSGHLMLSDFGIAKILDRPDAAQLTGTGVGIGTPEYMAPEQGMGGEVDQRADIYSLGIVFYEMLTGKKPYHADTPMAVMYKQINDPLTPAGKHVPGLPDMVEQVISKVLAKAPEDRYQDMASFAKALQKLVETTSAAATIVKAPQTIPARAAIAEQPVFRPGTPTPAPSTEAWEEVPAAPQKKTSRTWMTCSIIALVVLCIGAIITVAVTGGFGALIALFGPPEGLVVDVFVPTAVEMGRPFEITVSMRNDSDREIRVTEIQVPHAVLDIATVSSTLPLTTDIVDYSSTASTGYKFELPLAPGSSTDVSFRLQPLSVGDVTANWDVKVGTRTSSTSVRVIVSEAVAQLPTPTPTTAPTSTDVPTEPPPTPEAPPPTEESDEWLYVWEDDFSDPESGFFVGTSEDRAYEYKDGEYIIETRNSNWIAWVTLGYDLTTTEVAVDARIDRGTGDSGFGVLCRYQNDGDYYGFEVSEDGYYTIWLRYAGEYTTLVEWTYDDRITWDRPHTVAAYCLDDVLFLFFDTDLLAEAIDSTLTHGDVGLFVESMDIGGPRIAFDNFSLYEQ